MVRFVSNALQMMTLLNPLDGLIPTVPLSFFAEFWSGHLRGPGLYSREDFGRGGGVK